MATTDSASILHAPLTWHLLTRLRSALCEMNDDEFNEYLIENGAFQTDRVYELVSSAETGIPLDSVEGRDLADGSNCKLSGAYSPTNGQRTAWGWKIKVANCTGDVRAIVYHPIRKKVYEGFIPWSAHKSQRYLAVTDGVNGTFGRFTPYFKEVNS